MPKNAIVVMFDSLQFNYVGCYGNDWIKTPNMDRLAREGVLFENCYTYTMIREDGSSYQQPCYAHDFKGVYQAYRRMEDVLNEKELQKGNILSAQCHLMRATALWEKADAKYREDPHYFIGKL